MKQRLMKWLMGILRAAPFIVVVAFTVVYALSGADISAQTLLNYAPESPVLAGAFLIMMYALKSLSVMFPILALNIAGGFLFPTPIAIAVNAVGMVVELSIPYWIGRYSGKEYTDKLSRKYPKVAGIMNFGQTNAGFMTFFLRVITCLPMDIVSIYFGACRINFWIYLAGSFAGTIPMFVFATLLGTSITDLGSPMFWVSVGMIVGISAVSFLAYFIWRQRKRQTEK